MEQPLVSIITPVYNGVSYLAECIESVLAQDFNNWEYVLVNNRSTDNSLEIAQQYARRDPRIRIVNNDDFLPVMENLNHTFRQISPDSKYCKVIHADDWMFPECISRMVEIAENNTTVGIVNSYFLDDDIVRPEGIPYTDQVINGRELCRDYLLHTHSKFGSPSNILIKSELIRQRSEPYDPTNIHSDHGLCLDILKDHDMGFVHQVLTFSRRHEQSQTNLVAYKYGTFILGRIKNLEKYGAFYLSSGEFNNRMGQLVEIYHKNIAHKQLFGRSPKVLAFHRNEMKKLHIDIDKWKLFKYMLADIFALRRNFLALKNRMF